MPTNSEEIVDQEKNKTPVFSSLANHHDIFYIAAHPTAGHWNAGVLFVQRVCYYVFTTQHPKCSRVLLCIIFIECSSLCVCVCVQ